MPLAHRGHRFPLEHLLRAVGEQAVRGLRALDPPGGAGHAWRNVAQAASAERRERDAVSAWLAHGMARGPLRDQGLRR
ncbi:hypothetical protein [Streptomyces mirabilis]|uniref:hypothetical protein n=1 Tax=Streptomyces mirabilis TaxID=68239 RepID=UPI00365794C6